jgi:hypothetical protein
MEQGITFLQHQRARARREPEVGDPTSPFSPVWETLNEYAQKLYTKDYFDLSPRQQVVVSVAAFHPGARWLAQKYPLSILKSDIVLRWLLLARQDAGQLVPREYRIGKTKVKAVDLMRAANMGGVAFSKKGAQFLHELGYPTQVSEGIGHGIVRGLFGHASTVRFHTYQVQLDDGRTVRLLLPEPPTSGEQWGAFVGQTLADIPVTLLTMGALGRLLAGAPWWVRQLGEATGAGAAMGLVHGSQQGGSPKEVAAQAAREAASMGALAFGPVAVKGASRLVRRLTSPEFWAETLQGWHLAGLPRMEYAGSRILFREDPTTLGKIKSVVASDLADLLMRLEAWQQQPKLTWSAFKKILGAILGEKTRQAVEQKIGKGQ